MGLSFGKKPEKSQVIKEESKSDNQVSTDNIFEELSGELDFGGDGNSQEVEKKPKDTIYYLKLGGTITGIINFILFLIVIIGSGYVYIQNEKSYANEQTLDPICGFLLGDVDLGGASCSSVSYLLEKTENDIKEIKDTYNKKLSKIIPDLYSVKNFAFSKEIAFLIEKSENRLLPLEIIKEFDDLKIGFATIDKGQIVCKNINISSDNTFKLSCEAYSSFWDTEIIGYKGDKSDKIPGTSISIAVSFLNYIEKNSKNLEIIDKTKIFTVSSLSGDGGYFTQKTNFDVTFRYIPNTTFFQQ